MKYIEVFHDDIQHGKFKRLDDFTEFFLVSKYDDSSLIYYISGHYIDHEDKLKTIRVSEVFMEFDQQEALAEKHFYDFMNAINKNELCEELNEIDKTLIDIRNRIHM